MIISAMAVFLLSGCAVFLLGAGVVGGIAVSDDSATLIKEASFNNVWKVTQAHLDEMGTINREEKLSGTIEATINNSIVVVHITQLTAKSIKIEVSVRKRLMPNVDLAISIINEINNQLGK